MAAEGSRHLHWAYLHPRELTSQTVVTTLCGTCAPVSEIVADRAKCDCRGCLWRAQPELRSVGIRR